MKKLKAFLIAVLAVAMLLPQADACTSFAAYGDNVLYGMNFDFPDTDLRFALETAGDIRTFSMAFQAGDEFVPTVRMNSQGLFLSEQAQTPDLEKIKSLTGNQFYIGDVGPQVAQYRNTAGILGFIQDKRLVNRNVTVHHLVADPSGEAVVVEAGPEGNRLVEMEKNYLVMTNFTQADFEGKAKEAVTGAGADRYITACNMLEGTTGAITDAQGWEILKETKQSGSWSTQCSMLFDPGNQAVMIILKGRAETVWKLDMVSGILESTLPGVEPVSYVVDSTGVLASQLKADSAPTPDPTPDPAVTAEEQGKSPEIPVKQETHPGLLLFGIAAFFSVAIIIIVMIRKEKGKY